MKRVLCAAFSVLALCLWLTQPGAASSEVRKIDSSQSTITVRVFKTGFFSAFAHNHEIQAPIQSGEVQQSGSPSVELRVAARKMRVLDPEASQDTRAKIQETMLGTQVLDTEHFPEIHFQSTRVETKGTDHWIVHGNLALHGKERPIAVEVTLKDDRYRGSATFKQTDFGITPVAIAGGTVKVKDEVKIEFEIALLK